MKRGTNYKFRENHARDTLLRRLYSKVW